MSCCLCCPIRCQWKDKPSNLCGLLAGFLNPKLSTLFQDYEYEMLMHGSPRAALRIWLWTAIGKEENVPCQYSSVSCEEDIEESCQSRCCRCMNQYTQNTLSLNCTRPIFCIKQTRPHETPKDSPAYPFARAGDVVGRVSELRSYYKKINLILMWHFSFFLES